MSKGGKYRSMVEQQIQMTLGSIRGPSEIEPVVEIEFAGPD
jgi:hypothetical protein